MNDLGGSPWRARGSPHAACQQRREPTRSPCMHVAPGGHVAPMHQPASHPQVNAMLCPDMSPCQPRPAVHRHACSCWQFNTSEPAPQPLIAAPAMQPASVHLRVIACRSPPRSQPPRSWEEHHAHVKSACGLGGTALTDVFEVIKSPLGRRRNRIDHIMHSSGCFRCWCRGWCRGAAVGVGTRLIECYIMP